MPRAARVLPLVLLLGGWPTAIADTLDVLKTNTLVLTAPDGGKTVVLVGADGRMEQVNARGVWAAGFWSLAGSTFCWTARGAAEVCIALPADKAVGDRWEISGPTGSIAWTGEIHAGRADLGALSGEP
jgi:hypothetical protein